MALAGITDANTELSALLEVGLLEKKGLGSQPVKVQVEDFLALGDLLGYSFMFFYLIVLARILVQASGSQEFFVRIRIQDFV